jgi:short-subunit dehydrogenase
LLNAVSEREVALRKTILITGASSGLGRGMALEFAARGRNLALCARRFADLEALRAEIGARHPGVRVEVRELDVRDHDRVFAVFREFRAAFGTLDRVIVNAGIGKGAPLGTGNFRANRETAETNFVAALAQFEAALEIFRAQNAGHLVAIASVAAVRGMPRAQNVYAATKAGLASLAEGVRVELRGTPVRVTTVSPGFIDTAINAKVRNRPFLVDLARGSRALADAIEREGAVAYVPPWPWAVVARLLHFAPLGVLGRLS